MTSTHPASSAGITSVVAPSPTSASTSQRTSSQTPPSSTSASTSQRTSSQTPPSLTSRVATFSSEARTSSTPRAQAASTVSAIETFASSSSTSSSASQISSHASTDTQNTPLSHKPAVIAAIAVSVAVALFLTSLAVFIYRRRHARRHLASITSTQQAFFHDASADLEDKPWPQSSARSTAGPGWPSESQPWTVPIPLPVEREQTRTRQSVPSFSAKGPHYTVRSHASMTEVYGFGQDMAWQEAHYEDPLPPTPGAHPSVGVVPPSPTSPTSVIIHHNMASATPLLRSHSAASSVSSQYSTASMVLPDQDAPPELQNPFLMPDRMDERDWLQTAPDTQDSHPRV
ncbi:hypothetical protein B0H17DRAFT_289307 [Mycena rosella]|uniref:Uncharacterized protein n=1 Tax=Mycena rosella TaxID=1033263 RepID=A0AAD7G435_MYCRO|nr:hypothetical protein B0H17DRAFT_289307 [Mycena rosella]